MAVACGGGGGGGGGGVVDACPGQKVCGSGCISTTASCCSDGYHCVSPFTCNSKNECECPAGQQLCGNSCIPANASCCPNGSYCVSPETCNAANQCSSDGGGAVGITYHMFADGCPGGIIYGYTGYYYTACNMYVNMAQGAGCSKVINICTGY